MTEAETPSSAAATRESAPAEEALKAAARERELQHKLSEPAATTVASTSREPLVTTSSRSCPRWSAVEEDEEDEEEKEEDEGARRPERERVVRSRERPPLPRQPGTRMLLSSPSPQPPVPSLSVQTTCSSVR
jgi:hypothetical protein